MLINFDCVSFPIYPSRGQFLPSASTKFSRNFLVTHFFPAFGMSTSLAVRTVPFRRRSLHQMTASGQFGGTGSAGGGCFLLSSSCSSGAVSAAVPRSAATKCRSARSSSSSSSSTILSMMGGLSVRNGTGRGGPSSALSSVTRSARIRPRSYSTTPAVRQQHPKQAGGQKRSQSTIIGVPGGPQAGGAGAGNAAGRGAGGGTSTGGAGAGAGSMLGGALPPQAAQATWKEIFNLLRERCRVFLLKPRRLVSLNL